MFRWQDGHITHINIFAPFDNTYDKEYALVFMNSPTITEWSNSMNRLWNRAKWKVFIDGVINKLHKICANNNLIPDIISGDFDSADPLLLDYYKKKGVKIVHTPCQDKTDFQKALEYIEHSLNIDKKLDLTVVIGFQGGRLDHFFGNLSSLNNSLSFSFPIICLSQQSSLITLLNSGKYKIYIDEKFNKNDKHCGLIPLDRPIDSVTTEGFRWNLDHQEMSYDSIVSACNLIDNPSVAIETSGKLIFTCEFDPIIF